MGLVFTRHRRHAGGWAEERRSKRHLARAWLCENRSRANWVPWGPISQNVDLRRSLAVRRHLGFFEHHVTTQHWVVLLELQLALLLLLVLGGVVGESGSFARNQPDIVAHSGRAGTTVRWGVQASFAGLRRCLALLWRDFVARCALVPPQRRPCPDTKRATARVASDANSRCVAAPAPSRAQGTVLEAAEVDSGRLRRITGRGS